MKQLYYPKTTVSQREKLFEEWEKSKDIKAACQAARVGERTYYYWKPRYEAEGREGLKEVEKVGPKAGFRIKKEVQEKVKELKKANKKWGRRRIADEITKENNWVALVSPSSVQRILEKAGLLPEPEGKKTES